MVLQAIATLGLGYLAFRWGLRGGQAAAKRGATASDIFKGQTHLALLFLGLYIGLLFLALHVPQMQMFPLNWRVYGMQITWTCLRVGLIGFCGFALQLSATTARRQMVPIMLVGLLGIAGFGATEAYFLAPIHSNLFNNLQPNGVFKQTSMSSCAPAALATVFQRWDLKSATEKTVAEAAATSRLGTSMPQLIAAARQFGFDGLELENVTWEQLQRINRPGILGVWLTDGGRKLPHAMALLGINARQVMVGDPATGRILVGDRPAFADLWRQQYLPIYRPQDLAITQQQAQKYLRQSGLMRPGQSYNQALQQFQTDMGTKPTGYLDRLTTLTLMGPYLEQSPRLDRASIPQSAT